MKKNVLLVVSTLGQFPEIFKISKMLRLSERFYPIVYFNQGVDGDNPYVQQLIQHDIEVVGNHSPFIKSAVHVGEELPSTVSTSEVCLSEKKRKSFFKPRTFIKNNFPELFKFLKKFVHYYYKYVTLPDFVFRIIRTIKRFRREKALLLNHKICLIVLAEDSVDYNTPQLVHLGHELGIKSVVFPYTFANQFEFLEDAHFNNRTVRGGVFSFIAGVFFPKWRRSYKGKTLLKSSPSLIFATEIFGLTPPDPWICCSGFADVIAVESDFMKNYYSVAGIPGTQMRVTGYPSTDELHSVVCNRDINKKKTAIEIGVSDQKPWVLIAVPPTQWPRAAHGFSSYDEFLDTFISFFKSFDSVEVIFKFHPRESSEIIKGYCHRYKINYVSADTAYLIGMTDLYVASVSSTMRWALALGIPTINYDLYNYGYGDFEGADNFFSVVDFEQFKKVFLSEYSTLIGPNEAHGLRPQSKYAVLDGRASQRILDLFNSLVLTEKSGE